MGKKQGWANKDNKMEMLGVSILFDLIGMGTFAVPFLGEAADLIWAPIHTIIVYKMYGSMFSATLAGLEEFLPFTDIIPSATIKWAIFYSKPKNKKEKILEAKVIKEKK